MNRRKILATTASILGTTIAGCTDASDTAVSDPEDRKSSVTVSPGESVQKAVNTVENGGVVQLQEGVYNTHISIPRSMKITSKNGALLKPSNDRNDTGIKINGSNVAINNVSIDSHDTAIRGTGNTPETLTLSNLKITQCDIGVNAEVNDMKLQAVEVSECRSNGVAVILPDDGEVTINENSRFNRCGLESYEKWPAVYIEGGNSVGINNTIFTNNDGESIMVTPGKSKGQSVSITNCSISSNESNTFQVGGTFGEDSIEIKQTKFTGEARHIACGYEKPIESFTITSCDITAPGPPDEKELLNVDASRDGEVNIADCFASLDSYTEFQECNGMEISGGKTINISNTDIVGIQGTALWVGGGEQGQTVSIDGCRVTGAADTGIYHANPSVGNSEITINDCTVNKNGNNGMYIEVEDVTVSNTEAIENGGNGLKLTEIPRREATLNGNVFTK